MKCLLILSFLFGIFSDVARANDCRSILQKLFTRPDHQTIVASPKSTMKIDPETIKVQKGIIVEYHRDPITRQTVKTEYEVLRAVPDPETRFGRYVKSLDRQGTAFFFSKDHVELENSHGLFSRIKHFKVVDPDELIYGDGHFGKSIIVSMGQVDPKEFQVTLMHEAFHAYGERLREQGIQFRFNSMMVPGEARDSLLKSRKIYREGMHSEEIHTYVKDLVYQSVIAHNRETLRQIEQKAALFPSRMSKKDKYDRIRISFDSVMDSRILDDQAETLKEVLSIHEANLANVEKELIRLRAEKKNPNLIMSEEKKGKLLIETKDVKLFLENVSASKGILNPLEPLRKIREMRVYDRVLTDYVNELNAFVEPIRAKGYFTANEYLTLKDKMARLSKLVRVQGAGK